MQIPYSILFLTCLLGMGMSAPAVDPQDPNTRYLQQSVAAMKSVVQDAEALIEKPDSKTTGLSGYT